MILSLVLLFSFFGFWGGEVSVAGFHTLFFLGIDFFTHFDRVVEFSIFLFFFCTNTFLIALRGRRIYIIFVSSFTYIFYLFHLITKSFTLLSSLLILVCFMAWGGGWTTKF